MTVTALHFKADARITEVLSSGGFTISAEIIPPRNGSEQAQVLSQIEQLVSAGAQFLSVTKGAGGSLRGGSLPIAQVIKERLGVPCIAHFTCRDLTPHEVENQLMDHHYFGIRNILALRGDPPDGQANWKAREGGYNYAWQLIEQIRRLNQGQYLARDGGPASTGSEATGFCVGAAVYPEWPNERERLSYYKAKVDAGAEYAITDMLFDPESYARFQDACAREPDLRAIPVLPGTRILKSQAQARKMMEKFRVQVPSDTFQALAETDGPGSLERGLELFYGLVEKLRRYGAPGVHLFVISDSVGACAALSRLRSDSLSAGETP